MTGYGARLRSSYIFCSSVSSTSSSRCPCSMFDGMYKRVLCKLQATRFRAYANFIWERGLVWFFSYGHESRGYEPRPLLREYDLRLRETGHSRTTPNFNILLGNHNETRGFVVDFYTIEMRLSFPVEHRLTAVNYNANDKWSCIDDADNRRLENFVSLRLQFSVCRLSFCYMSDLSSKINARKMQSRESVRISIMHEIENVKSPI